MLILDLRGISFHPVVFVGLGNDLLFNFIVGHCAMSLAGGSSEPSQGSWACWFTKFDANLHQFTLTKGGCTKIKLIQKAPSSGIFQNSPIFNFKCVTSS